MVENAKVNKHKAVVVKTNNFGFCPKYVNKLKNIWVTSLLPAQIEHSPNDPNNV